MVFNKTNLINQHFVPQGIRRAVLLGNMLEMLKNIASPSRSTADNEYKTWLKVSFS